MNFDTPYIAAAERNVRPILGVLEHELRSVETVLEIGTGTAQQAEVFVGDMPWLSWQTSDLADYHPAILERVANDPTKRLLPPRLLDMLAAVADGPSYDAVYSSNTAHIMSAEAVERMFAYVGGVLKKGGMFVLYGPFRMHGEFTTESNASFDASLRGQDASMGLRDLETLDELGRVAGLRRKRLYAMPSNNLLAIWIRKRRVL